MGIKRIIAPEGFNTINGCFFEDFVTHGQLPKYLLVRYSKTVDTETKRTPIKISKEIQRSLSCKGDFYISKYSERKERSPHLHVHYFSEKEWDVAINKICSVWNKEATVLEMITKNRENGAVILWKRTATENGNQASQLALSFVDDVAWTECHYKTQRMAAGELWSDTCEFDNRQRNIFLPTCVVGSHAAA